MVLAFAVSVGAYTLVGISRGMQVTIADIAAVGGGLALLTLALHVVIRVCAPYADPVILPIATMINGLGLVEIHRLDLAHARALGSSLALRQLIWTAVGIAAAAAVLIFVRDHRGLARFTYTAMAASMVLLLAPLVPGLGQNINGARIWIRIGPMSFQPGEMVKLTLALFFAGYLVTARDSLSLVGNRVLGLQLPRGRDLGPILLAWMASVAVLVLETDLGMSLLYFGLFVAMLYVATERTSWVVIGLGLFMGGAYLAWTLFAHVKVRVAIWLNPFDPANADRAYQLLQGLYGLANGGMMGTGLGAGKPYLVPFAESDFIYTSIGEELGLGGLVALLLLYGLLVERGLVAGLGVRDGFGKLLACGVSFSLALQVFVVVGGVTRVIPLSGVAMPFLAYGGSSLLSSWMIVGILLRISDSARRPTADTAPGGFSVRRLAGAVAG
jgi:cell division protein FtsW (lipid II flippase)